MMASIAVSVIVHGDCCYAVEIVPDSLPIDCGVGSLIADDCGERNPLATLRPPLDRLALR